MRVICKNCKKSELLHPRENKYVVSDSHFCSYDCLLEFIKNYDAGTDETPYESPYLFQGQVDSEGTGELSCYSEMLEITFRSRYEARVCEALKRSKILFEYEPFRFLFPHEHGDVTWQPDIYLPEQKLFLEVKGLKGVSFRKKLECFKRFTPFDVLVISWTMRDGFPELYDPVKSFFEDGF